jgi:hypothetical protein
MAKTVGEGQAMDSAASARDALVFSQQAEQILAHLCERLAPEDYRLVRQLLHLEELAIVAACTAAEERLLAAVVAHCSDHTLALEATIAHVRATNADCETLQRRAARRAGT